jgi:REP element-mobilizing transposase RayT
MNRGIAKRTVFENVDDKRYFLAQVAWAVHAGWIELAAFCVMPTHFHLLVRSTEALLSRAMGQVLNNYVRWFNRGRKRDGPLFRSRFLSRPVDSLEYWLELFRYLDANPVEAGLAPSPALYPHCSAWWYALPEGPIWLERSWIEDHVRSRYGTAEYDPQHYLAMFGGASSPSLARVIERRIESGVRSPDPLDDLLGATPERVLDWMRRKAALADGTCIDLPVCDPADVLQVLAVERRLRPDWRLPLTRVPCDAWPPLGVALVRDLCAATWAEIGIHLGISDNGAMRAYRRHGQALSEATEYAAVAGRLAAEAIARCYGARSALGTKPRIGVAEGWRESIESQATRR